jgi:hypothetical protein
MIAHGRAYVSMENGYTEIVAYDLATGERDIRFGRDVLAPRYVLAVQTDGIVVRDRGFVWRFPVINSQDGTWRFEEWTEAVAATDALVFVALRGKPGIVDR